MPLKEAFRLVDGKAAPGETVLFDSRAGQYYDVVRVMSGKDIPTADHPYFRGSTAEQCATFGAKPKRIRKKTPCTSSAISSS